MASESLKESVTTAYVPKIKSYHQCYNRPVCQSMGTFCNCSIKENCKAYLTMKLNSIRVWCKTQGLYSLISICHIILSHIKEYVQSHTINSNTYIKIQPNWEFIEILLGVVRCIEF